MKKTITGFILVLFSLTIFANTSTLVTITKTTTLTGKDAADFSHLFGQSFAGNNTFIYICKKNKCQVAATKDTFKGKLAENILKERPWVRFVSKDKKFILDCGRGTTAYCNVTQRSAILS